MSTQEKLLEVSELERYFYRNDGIISRLLGNDEEEIGAVDGVSFDLHRNEVIGIIGESGCGKTTLMMTLMGLQDPTGGTIEYLGDDVTQLDRTTQKSFRNDVQFIFQDPFNSLDPKLTVRESLYEPLKIHGMEDKEQRVLDVLGDVELSPPERYLDRLPKQLSGGEKQRVSIARALVLEPNIILADEPVSMLDVSTQASILNLLSELVEEYGVSMVYVSHDLSTVSYICDLVNVMYLGRIVESAPTSKIINEPKHPYTKELIRAVPIPDPHHERERTSISGAAPDPINLGEGCRFADRCEERMDICNTTPEYVEVESENEQNSGRARHAACHLYYDHSEQGGVHE